MGLPVVREERRLVQHPAGHVELAARPVDVADRRIAGNDPRHLLPQALVRAERRPVEASGRQDQLGEGRDDLDLGAEIAVHGRLAALGQPNEVEHRLLRRALRLLVAGEHGQDDRRLAAAVDVALVQLGGEGDGERQAAQRGAGPRAIGVAGEEVPAEQDRGAHAALGGRGHRRVGVEARRARHRDAVDFLHPRGERRLQLRRDADRADALHVRVTADREETRAGASEPAARECQVREREHVVDAVRVMGEPHRPGGDAALRAEQHGDGRVDLGPWHAGGVDEHRPRRRREVRLDRIPAARVRRDEAAVDTARLDDALQQRLEHRHVGPDVGLEVDVGDAGAEEKTPPVGGHAKADETELAQRVDDDHAAAAPPERDQLCHETRMVARRVRARDEREVGCREVVEADRRGAGAVDLAERHARGVVAVEGAIVDVGRSPGARHHLHEERRLVARPSGGVEERLRGRCRAEARRRAVERLAPRDAPEMRVAGAGEQRKPETAETLELARPELLEAHERRRPEDLFGDRPGHVARLRLHGFLADLGEVTGLVGHAALLPAHADPARLAGVARAEAAVETDDAARLAPLPEDVEEGGEAASRADARVRHSAEARPHAASAASAFSRATR